jgi:hypothetical protein
MSIHHGSGKGLSWKEHFANSMRDGGSAMDRKQFIRSLVLGGIVIPHVPKLIMTGGWFEPDPWRNFAETPIGSRPNPGGLTIKMLREAKQIMDEGALPDGYRIIYCTEEQYEKVKLWANTHGLKVKEESDNGEICGEMKVFGLSAVSKDPALPILPT